jgi:hypothetical protein
MFENDEELTNALREELKSIIDTVTEKLLKKLVDDDGFIDSIVYKMNSPSAYQRQGKNGGLLGMWDKTPAKISGEVISSEITEYPELLTVDSEKFIHGSLYWVQEDISRLLTEIIVEGKSGPFWGEGFWRSPRDFWQPFVKLLDDGTVQQWIELEFRKRGMRYTRV